MSFVLSNKAESDRVSKVNEANFIRTGALILIFYIVANDIMTDNNSNHKVIELFILRKEINVIYDEITCINFSFLKLSYIGVKKMLKLFRAFINDIISNMNLNRSHLKSLNSSSHEVLITQNFYTIKDKRI